MDVRVCNNSSLTQLAERLTFRSVCGVKRVLDYCIASVGIQMKTSKPIDALGLRSDHRAVQTCFMLPPVDRPRTHHERKRHINWAVYDTAANKIKYDHIHSLPALEKQLCELGDVCQKQEQADCKRPWDSAELQRLRAQRKSATTALERKEVSKRIWRLTRSQLRVYRTQEAEKKLTEFSKLESLQKLHLYPIKKKHTCGPNLEKCAELLKHVYTIETESNYAKHSSIPLFTYNEFEQAIRKMKKGRCADKLCIYLEMFVHNGKASLEVLLTCLNEVLAQDAIPSTWCDTFFSLLHKGGCVDDANNWRPVAILSITYKIFARLVHDRIQQQLQSYQSEDQFGFRPGRSTSHALLILESMLSKGIEYHFPVWVIMIDSKKAFDRVDHKYLFHALRGQMDGEYVKLLERLYEHQTGNVGEYRFRISRGVRQGDILSPLLFNAVMEHLMRKWKRRLRSHGFCLHPNNDQERLTNIRYADDILLFGKSPTEVVTMLELFVEVLEEYGLSLNVKKTKVLSTETAPNGPSYCDTECGMIEMLSENQKHKYLGRMFSGDVRKRGKVASEFRISCGGMKYHALQNVFEDEHTPIKLRLKLFDAVITATVLYSLDTCPLTANSLQRLDVAQRTMMRRIIGWVCVADDSWEERGHRMKIRFQRCMAYHPTNEWSDTVNRRKDALVNSIDVLPFLTVSALRWDPIECESANFCEAYRMRGRPFTRWA